MTDQLGGSLCQAASVSAQEVRTRLVDLCPLVAGRSDAVEG
jgi:hypothetical protein